MNNLQAFANTSNMEIGKKRKLKKALFILSGIFVGAANGFFGGGGGMLAVPALQFLGDVEERKAHATALAVILPLSIITAILYTLKGSFEIKGGLIVGGGVIVGGIVGALLLKKLPAKVLNVIFYLLMLVAGVRMIL